MQAAKFVNKFSCRNSTGNRSYLGEMEPFLKTTQVDTDMGGPLHLSTSCVGVCILCFGFTDYKYCALLFLQSPVLAAVLSSNAISLTWLPSIFVNVLLEHSTMERNVYTSHPSVTRHRSVCHHVQHIPRAHQLPQPPTTSVFARQASTSPVMAMCAKILMSVPAALIHVQAMKFVRTPMAALRAP